MKLKKKILSLALTLCMLISLMPAVTLPARAEGEEWLAVGSAGFSAGQVNYTSLAFCGSTPYVAYRDDGNSYKATVMKFNGTSWVPVGTEGFSAGQANNISLAFDGSGIPYVAYADGGNGYKATVKKFNGTSWEAVGTEGFSAGEADYTSLAFCDGTPCVAYADGENGYKATVMKYTGSGTTGWETVGSVVSGGLAYYTSLAFCGGTPYVAYEDGENDYKATVMKLNGTSWEAVGSAGFSTDKVYYTFLAFYNGTPYVAYEDIGNDGRATVMKLNGASWEAVGSAGFSAGDASCLSLAFCGGTPYVAYADGGNNYKATVMEYIGSGTPGWETVGSAGFSAGLPSYTSLAFSDGTPYVAYVDNGNSKKATVMKYGLPVSSPTVTTDSVTEYGSSSATMGGEVTDDGGGTVTDRGVVYSTTDNTPEIREPDATQDSNGTGTGAFGESVGSLSPDTKYYVRAYATNSGGTSYGSVAEFTTRAAGAPDETVYPYYVITEGETESDDIHVYKKADSAGNFTAFNTGYSDITTAMSDITADVSAGSVTLRFGLTGTDASAAGTLDIGTESINLGASGAYTIKGKLTGSGSSVIDLSGASALANGADIENSLHGIVINNIGVGSVAVAAGTLEARYGGKVIQSTGSGNITVSGGTLQSTGGGSQVIFNSGSGDIVVSGGEIDGDTVAIGNSGTGSISISGGEINCVFNCIYNEGTGSISLSGGTMSSERASAIDNEDAGSITISGTAEITSDYVWDTVYLAGGTSGETILEMTGGSVRNTCALPLGTEECPGPDFALCIGNDGAGTVIISGGTLAGGTHGVGFFNYDTGTFKISGGNISGGAYGGYNGSTGLVYLSGVDTAITGGIADIGICEPGTVFANDGGDTPSYYSGDNINVYYDGDIQTGVTVAVGGVSDSSYSKFSLTNEGYTLTRDVDNLLITEGGSEPDTYTIAAVSDQTLTNLTAGYSSGAQEVRTITINRTGTGELTNLTVALSGTNASSFMVTQPVSDVLNDSTASTTFIIKAVDSLPAGTYTATMTISADYMTPVSFAVTQAVNSHSGGGDGDYTPSRTITVTETSSDLFSGSEGQIRAEANMNSAFSNSVEVKVTDTEQSSSGFGLGAGSEVYPFDISLYIKGTNTKTEPKDGYAVTISLPVPDKLLDMKEQLSIVHKSDDGTVSTLKSQLKQINGVWYLVFEATEFSPYALAVKNTAAYDESAGLPYYVGSDGNEMFIGFAANGKYIAPSGVTVLLKENAKSFTDTGSHWAKDYIKFVTERELFNGTGDNRFSPDTGMTRAMFATVIGRLYERSYGKIEALSGRAFSDCNYDDYYGKYVDWAAENGIIGGYGNGKFGPDDQITREQMAAILYRFAEFLGVLPGNMDTALNYPDSGTVSSWAQSAALYCQSTGIITGRGGGNFVPQGTATRAEVAAIIQRFIEKVVK